MFIHPHAEEGCGCTGRRADTDRRHIIWVFIFVDIWLCRSEIPQYLRVICTASAGYDSLWCGPALAWMRPLAGVGRGRHGRWDWRARSRVAAGDGGLASELHSGRH